jgi:superfamily II DNA or RNA helicase
MSWQGPDSELALYLKQSNEQILAAYREKPLLAYEAANIERATAQGGYGRRQLYELIQNAADAIHEANAARGSQGGDIHLVLANDVLYCANEGAPIDHRGLDALLSSHISEKRGAEIGRFGLGFKSVLGVTTTPEFFSRTISFRFDAEWSRKVISEEVPGIDANPDDRTPVLRLARALRPEKEAEGDAILAELMEWASTVVRLPLDGAEAEWLPEDLTNFPPEFLLFAPHVSGVRFENRGSLFDRKIELSSLQETRALSDSLTGTKTEWRIFEVPTYRPSEAAKRDAGELAKRDEVPLIWAVPMGGQSTRERGQFWAFFPTEYETTLKGILNAPWKTNEDRQNLLRGSFNEELIDQFAHMVVDNLPNLVDPGDPGAFLELLPARGRESPSWADELLTRLVYQFAGSVPSLPDQTGSLRQPSDVELHPKEATVEALAAWTSHPSRPVNWCHPSVSGDTRYSRAVRLLAEGQQRRPALLDEWLEAVAEDLSADGSSAAIRAAAEVLQADARTAGKIKDAYIVLTATEQLAQPDPHLLFITKVYASLSSDMHFVHPSVIEVPAAVAALSVLGIVEADELGELKAIVNTGLDASTDWDAFWVLVASIDAELAVSVFGARASFSDIRVKTLSGAWRSIRETWLPGGVILDDPGTDDQHTVDVGYHDGTRPFLDLLGASDRPWPKGGSVDEAWFKAYRREMLGEFISNLGPRQNPERSYIGFDDRHFPGPLLSLETLSDGSRIRLTEATLALETGDAWTMRHSTQDRYPSLSCTPPAVWYTRRFGLIATSGGAVPPSLAVGPGFDGLADFFPVFDGSLRAASLLGLPTDPSGLQDAHWEHALGRALTNGESAEALGAFYTLAAQNRPAPGEIRAQVGPSFGLMAPDAVTVVTSRHEYDALRGDSIPVLLVGSDVKAEDLVKNWQLQPSSAEVSTEIVHVPITRPIPVVDRYPDLRLVLRDDQSEYELQACESIQQFVLTTRGRKADELDHHTDDRAKVIYFRENLEESQVLDLVAATFDLGLGRSEIDGIIENRRTAEQMNRLRSIAALETDEARLLELVGSDTLKPRLPLSLLETVESEGRTLDGELLARLFLSTYGVSALKELKDELRGKGWPAPTAWAGSRPAVEFVKSLGFDTAYAGTPGQRRDPILVVHGPVSIPKMHAFQRQIADRTSQLLRMEDGDRALLSLPTGAGKTRVAAESIIESIVEGVTRGPVLWVAQTDELCEQAVQTWAYLWRGLGSHLELTISRLWAGNYATPADSGAQLVVATIAKLDAVLDHDEYAWLRNAECLVIDEAHAATTPSYTRLLRRVGLQRGKRRVPLIGLTATPFRGTSERETERLVKRFGGQRLDSGVFNEDPYGFLQDMGVLAKVDHQSLTGTDVALTPSELAELERTRRLPSNVSERIGADRSRNRTLLESIRSLPKDWPVLLFAPSVDHAQTMAALLGMEGISAAAISATTEAGARRHYIEAFRDGDVRVLANYAVLTQGFDAPATRAVYVARPTFSPNVYQQMIGRGLRGPLNGGKDVCLIVNVEDTFHQFGEQLAFTQFEHLWSRDV